VKTGEEEAKCLQKGSCQVQSPFECSFVKQQSLKVIIKVP